MVFGNEIVVDIIRKEGVIVEQGGPLALYDWCPYETGKCGHRSRHTRGKDNMKTLGRRRLRGRQGKPGAIRSWREAWNSVSPGTLEGAQPAHILIWGSQPPKLRQRISIVLSYPFRGTLLQQPQETNTN